MWGTIRGGHKYGSTWRAIHPAKTRHGSQGAEGILSQEGWHLAVAASAGGGESPSPPTQVPSSCDRTLFQLPLVITPKLGTTCSTSLSLSLSRFSSFFICRVARVPCGEFFHVHQIWSNLITGRGAGRDEIGEFAWSCVEDPKTLPQVQGNKVSTL